MKECPETNSQRDSRGHQSPLRINSVRFTNPPKEEVYDDMFRLFDMLGINDEIFSPLKKPPPGVKCRRND